MGQAALDLPDPLESPRVSPASTDDLLAQWAGEEIERLLSESDADAAPASPGPSLSDAPAPTPLPPKAEASAPLASAPASPAPRATDQDLSALFSQLEAPDAATKKPQEKSASALAADAAPSVADELSREMDEDAAVAVPSPEAAGAKTEAVPKAVSGDPLVLRVLAWVNAPLDSFPDHVREVVGKIAILTTVNALSVLVYVLFFRRH